MSEYVNVSSTALEIGGGKLLAPGERTETISDRAKRLVEQGKLVKVAELDEPAPKKAKAKKSAPKANTEEESSDAAGN